MTAKNKELLPCPFCGGSAEFTPYKKDGITLKCQSFGCVKFTQRTLRHSLEWLQERMSENWNRRAQPPADTITVPRSEWEAMQRDAENWKIVKPMIEISQDMLAYFSWTYRMKPMSRLNASDKDQLVGQDMEFTSWVNALADASGLIDAKFTWEDV